MKGALAKLVHSIGILSGTARRLRRIPRTTKGWQNTNPAQNTLSRQIRGERSRGCTPWKKDNVVLWDVMAESGKDRSSLDPARVSSRTRGFIQKMARKTRRGKRDGMVQKIHPRMMYRKKPAATQIPAIFNTAVVSPCFAIRVSRLALPLRFVEKEENTSF
jgi:hypothetical protein